MRWLQAEPEGEGEAEAEAEAEAEPELTFADWQFGESDQIGWTLWGVHWILFGSLFLVGFLSAVGALADLKRQKKYGLNVQTVIRASIGLGCLWRALDLFIDPYNARGVLPTTLEFILYGQAFPCFMTGFALNMLRFIEVFSQIDLAKLGKLGELKRRAKTFLPTTRRIFVWTSGAEFLVQLVSDIIIAQGTGARVAFAIICQGYFLLWGAFLSACFIHFAFRLRTVMRAGGTIAGKTRAMFFVTRASCFVCLVWIAIAAWWLAAVVNDKNVTDVNVVTIFGLQTASRIAELLVVYLLIPSPLGTLCRIVGAKAGVVDPPKNGGSAAASTAASSSISSSSSSINSSRNSSKVAVSSTEEEAATTPTPTADEAAGGGDAGGNARGRSSIIQDRYGGHMPRASVYEVGKKRVGHGELDTTGTAGEGGEAGE